jgi:hypothetical protein
MRVQALFPVAVVVVPAIVSCGRNRRHSPIEATLVLIVRGRPGDVTNRKRKHVIETSALTRTPELLLGGSLLGEGAYRQEWPK